MARSADHGGDVRITVYIYPEIQDTRFNRICTCTALAARRSDSVFSGDVPQMYGCLSSRLARHQGSLGVRRVKRLSRTGGVRRQPQATAGDEFMVSHRDPSVIIGGILTPADAFVIVRVLILLLGNQLSRCYTVENGRRAITSQAGKQTAATAPKSGLTLTHGDE